MKKQIITITSILALLSAAANAEEVWVKSGGIQKFFSGTTLATSGWTFDTTEKTANYEINFNEDAKYVFGFSVNYGGTTYINNKAQVMFGINGKDYSIVIGKSETAHLNIAEVQGNFFASTSVYVPNYGFTANPLTVLPNITVLESSLPRAGSYSYEITLTTSSSGKGKVSVFVSELNKHYEYDLKLAGEVATTLIGLRFYGDSATSPIDHTKSKIASVGSGIAVQKYVLQKTGTHLPEPSAFGLLAGVGALALVASRRRRK
ncbi:MAG: PEP-CTERM sorting domain-containing protein [Opitutales bacterium]|nr:PEP-CTERM sorting domain-containing protein [Opitutales bacterium]